MLNRLKVRRAELGLTQMRTARKARVAVWRLSHIETDQLDPTNDEIVALARALDCRPVDIFPTFSQLPSEVA